MFKQFSVGSYPLGSTPVTLTVTELENLSNSCTVNVIVKDMENPTISCSTPTAECTSLSGAVVNFNATFADNCPGVIDSCTPFSGSTFPLGMMLFSCTVTDTSRN